MNNQGKSNSSQRLMICFMVLSIVLTVFLSYGNILDYFFTTPDTYTALEEYRIQSFHDVLKILSEKLMSRYPYYRPISSLSFSLDYYIWKLDPFGYQLTNFIFHATVSILVFILIRLLTGGNNITAWLGSFIFTIHPAISDAVYGTTNRIDVLACLFILLSLIFYVKYSLAAFRKKRYLVFSILSYIAALGSKEIAIILPFLIFTYLIIVSFSYEKSFKIKIVLALIKCIPYILLTCLYFVLRSHIVHGLGVYTTVYGNSLFSISVDIFSVIRRLIDIASSYFAALLYPFDFLKLNYLLNALTVTGKRIVFLITLFTFFSVFLFKYEKIKNKFPVLSGNNLMLFLFIWLLTPLCLFILAIAFADRWMYIPTIPFSVILSIILVESFQSALKKIKDRSSLINGATASFTIAAALLISLLMNSPLVKKYRHWEVTGDLSRSLLYGLSEIISELPNDASIHIYNLPGRVIYKGELPDARYAFCSDSDAIKSWINVKHPGNNIKIVPYNSHWITVSSDSTLELNLEVQKKEDNNIAVNVVIKGNNLGFENKEEAGTS